MRRFDPPVPTDSDHGLHTLRPWRGVVVGFAGDDVFVELGPRMQGVISRRRFEEPPEEGDVHTFTLCGKEEGLWALRLMERGAERNWETMVPGSVVHARAVRQTHGGLQLKIGPLHAFMPTSQAGLPRGRRTNELVGKTFACEVIEVDRERQRVVVSRRLVVKRERESAQSREVGGLHVGQLVQGRVTRIEDYGVFLRFGRGLTGLVHVSNLSHDRVEHPTDLVAEGDTLEARVLYVRQGGRRIGLGVKQVAGNPWRQVEKENWVGQLVDARVVRLADFGAFLQLRPGVEGLLPLTECGEPGRRTADFLRKGQELTVRILELDPEAERACFSLLHQDGARIQPGEAEGQRLFAERESDEGACATTNLGEVLRQSRGGGSNGQRRRAL